MQRFVARVSTTIGIAVVSLGFTALAGAKDSDASVSRTEVFYSDLDLGHVSDATELYVRIERAARDVCRVGSAASARAHGLERQCVAQAIDNAVQSVGNANLTAVHATRAARRSMVASSR